MESTVENGKEVAEGTGKRGFRRVSGAALAIPRFARRVVSDRKTKAVPVCVVEELPDEIMECYLSVLVWLVHYDDSQIDERELCEIQLLMAQRGCSADVRGAVRERLENPQDIVARKQVDRIRQFARMSREGSRNDVPGGQGNRAATELAEEAVLVFHSSLMKDAIRVRRATSDGPVREQPGIQQLAQTLELNDEQAKVIEEACSREDKILNGDLPGGQIKGAMTELAARATSVGVPVTMVYAAGSVTGLSAAGITSGLATLGLGGVLGLSAMASGIGVAVVGGGIAYKGVRWVFDRSRRDRSALRELMLQEVLRIHQQAIINLGQDMSFFAKRIADLAGETERNRGAIDWLTREVTLLSRSAGALSVLGDRADRFGRNLQDVAGKEEETASNSGGEATGDGEIAAGDGDETAQSVKETDNNGER